MLVRNEEGAVHGQTKAAVINCLSYRAADVLSDLDASQSSQNIVLNGAIFTGIIKENDNINADCSFEN